MSVEALRVCKVYRRKLRALEEVSVRAETGILFVTGPAGAGKSTLLALLSGQVAPTSGTVSVNGLDTVQRAAEVRQRVGYLPAGSGLPLGFTVPEALDYLLLLRRQGTADTRAQSVERAMEAFGLRAASALKIRDLPVEQRRLAAVAAVSLGEPSVLVLDEPTAGLESTAAARVYATIAQAMPAALIVLAAPSLDGLDPAEAAILVLSEGRRRYFGCAAGLIKRAEGRFWEAQFPAGAERPLPYGFVLTERRFATNGAVQLRGVCEGKPFPEALPAAPTLLDAQRWAENTGESLESAGAAVG